MHKNSGFGTEGTEGPTLSEPVNSPKSALNNVYILTERINFAVVYACSLKSQSNWILKIIFF